MKAWVVRELGPHRDVLRLEDVPAPSMQAGAARIRVEATALNFLDLLVCQGQYQEKPPLPFTPGVEVSGIVEDIAEDVAQGAPFHMGDRVIALPALPAGGLAEQVVVPLAQVHKVPRGASPAEAAAMFITYHTAYYALHRLARLQPGEVLLVHAGAGGVGSAAIQLGKAAGARVIATAGGPEKVETCRQLGADEAIDYRTGDFVEAVKAFTQGRGADVIFDPVGGDVFDQSRKCIAFEGRLLVIGFASGRIPQAPMNHALVKNYSLVGVHWGLFHRLYPEAVREMHDALLRLYEAGQIRPLVRHIYPFEEAIQAMDALGGRQSVGKVIVAAP
ncbi:NADPH:quinone oxidoreductase family protein [Alicyclobacillus vulcanalis]|uniref:NADPH2:quinone reductase n=1 Tax=Alicyclobacillus vulcanalis TaxID=252246 RepID=A0A1N7LHD5_9BACL|nr:NADPH:quinone oxidoreductase family protein [Alicyclobacillus vulcanalis]SIS73181.1 NADPH2:quinone reductase [Alicyclobacillus vulcanalis]